MLKATLSLPQILFLNRQNVRKGVTTGVTVQSSVSQTGGLSLLSVCVFYRGLVLQDHVSLQLLRRGSARRGSQMETKSRRLGGTSSSEGPRSQFVCSSVRVHIQVCCEHPCVGPWVRGTAGLISQNTGFKLFTDVASLCLDSAGGPHTCAFSFCEPAPSFTYCHFSVSSTPFNDQNAAHENLDSGFLFKHKTKPDRRAAVTAREAGPSWLSQHQGLGASAVRGLCPTLDCRTGYGQLPSSP